MIKSKKRSPRDQRENHRLARGVPNRNETKKKGGHANRYPVRKMGGRRELVERRSSKEIGLLSPSRDLLRRD